MWSIDAVASIRDAYFFVTSNFNSLDGPNKLAVILSTVSIVISLWTAFSARKESRAAERSYLLAKRQYEEYQESHTLRFNLLEKVCYFSQPLDEKGEAARNQSLVRGEYFFYPYIITQGKRFVALTFSWHNGSPTDILLTGIKSSAEWEGRVRVTVHRFLNEDHSDGLTLKDFENGSQINIKPLFRFGSGEKRLWCALIDVQKGAFYLNKHRLRKVTLSISTDVGVFNIVTAIESPFVDTDDPSVKWRHLALQSNIEILREQFPDYDFNM